MEFNKSYKKKRPNFEFSMDNVDFSNYQSPIQMLETHVQTQIEDDVIKAVQSVGITVDKGRLIRALRYDREQYARGYTDGWNKAINVVHCKDCKHFATQDEQKAICWCMRKAAMRVSVHDFCSFGEERKRK